MQLACYPSIRPCPKIAQLGTTWKKNATFALPSLALKRPMRQPLVAGLALNRSISSRFVTRCTQKSELREGNDNHLAKENDHKVMGEVTDDHVAKENDHKVMGEVTDDHVAKENDHKVMDDHKMMENERKAMDTVLVLYTAIKNRNLRELSDVIAEECRFVCNSISSLTAFQGKNQVLEFFSSLMNIMGENLQFVIQPSPHGGMNVSVTWSLVLNETKVPLGKGHSFYTCHSYQGKAVIRDAHMFIEPLFQMQPAQWKIFAFLLPIFRRISTPDVAKNKLAKSLMYCFLTVVFFTTLFVMVKHILF